MINPIGKPIHATLCLWMLAYSCVYAQSALPLGQWRTHYTYQAAYGVARYNKQIYSHAQHSLLTYTFGAPLNIHTSVEGLAQSAISVIRAASGPNPLLAVGHKDGHMAFLRNGKWNQVRSLHQAPLHIERSIRTFFFSEKRIYVGGAFGLLVLNEKDFSVIDSYVELGAQGNRLSVLGGAVLGDSLFVVTSQGLIVGHSSDNLLDPRQWHRQARLRTVRALLHTEAQELWALAPQPSGTDLLRYAKGEWHSEAHFPNTQYHSLVQYQSELLLIHSQGVDAWHSGTNPRQLFQLPEATLAEAVVDEQVIWFANTAKGLGRWHNGQINYYHPPAPLPMHHPIVRRGAKGVYVFPSQRAIPHRPAENVSALAYFDNAKWHNARPSPLGAVIDVAHINDKTYLCGHETGVWEATPEGYQMLSPPSGALKNAFQGASAITPLPNGQLIVASKDPQNPLIRYTPTKGWSSLLINANLTGKPIYITHVPYRNLVIGVWQNTQNDELWIFNTETGASIQITRHSIYTPARVYAIHMQDTRLWIATSAGLFTVSLYGTVASDILPQRFFIAGRELLSDQPVYSIAQDGGKRLWLGLASGIWVLNSFDARIEARFDPHNSPLPEGEVHALTFTNAGVLWMGVPRGVVAYRSLTSTPAPDFKQARIYPNPVPATYTGWVAMTELPYASIVHITSVSGQLLRVLRTQGGTAAWDLADATGRRLPSGIYVLYAVQPDGTKAFAGKIALLK